MNRLLLAVLGSPVHGLFDGEMIGLRYLSKDGDVVSLPVAYVRSRNDLVVLVGGSSKKTWWRHFLTRDLVDILWQGAWRPTAAQVFPLGTPKYLGAAIAYRTQHPHLKTSKDPIVLITIPAMPEKAPPSLALT